MYLPMEVHHGQYGDRSMQENLEHIQVNKFSVSSPRSRLRLLREATQGSVVLSKTELPIDGPLMGY